MARGGGAGALLPFFTALGAGGGRGRRLHHSYTYEVLAMDAYGFGGPAELARLTSDAQMRLDAA